MDEHPAKIAIATLADAQQLWFIAAAMLLGYESEPGGKLASLMKRSLVADGSDYGRGYEGTDSRNLTQPTAGFVLVCRLLDVFG